MAKVDGSGTTVIIIAVADVVRCHDRPSLKVG
jgi:hypothetical protein